MPTVLVVTFFSALASTDAVAYDPGKSSGKVTVFDTEFQYGDDRRKVPLRIYLPEGKSKSPVILFSHGLGGSKDNNPYLGNHWAGRGYVVVFMQHAGSDENVWKEADRTNRFKQLSSAASYQSFLSRTRDVPAALDQLEKWNQKHDKLLGRLDLKKVGMSGHSFGAVTTQALSGQNFGRRGPIYTDSRISAAIAMSPSLPQLGKNADTFGKVKIPWMLMTGTKDKSIIGRTKPEERLKVFQQLPKTAGHFYELVLHDAEHMAFSERKLGGFKHRNPQHHQSILALSSAFWDTYLRGNPDAKRWLNGEKAKQVLDSNDRWQRK